ncbi:unnamed protein product [Haemonchus placei]|uniref:14_3_3 domain-containing protein n=1 Tax=Haemonchus placei TaxID=6290 RepID=A0A0N4WNJ5_HAEPC|nr:unnamed protein product [Haemonchus placei]
MEEAKEELDAAILQAKNHCISLQQNVWDHEKSNLSPVEDLYVRRYIYAVTVARNIRFFNGVCSFHSCVLNEKAEVLLKCPSY